jgi:hypothetical protein
MSDLLLQSKKFRIYIRLLNLIRHELLSKSVRGKLLAKARVGSIKYDYAENIVNKHDQLTIFIHTLLALTRRR